ncbi:P-loop NTPase [Natranaerobius trueperi]|uniref:Uncharacterized protein n=1 Tax=Natranaerobius trueperi TaxID=759412 RepID=A0A226BYX9_9FIRM|nr:P-loop NTPase [Natranaerobius trueperi]OWZ84248.1 hypothetical protein CDO51_04105 [Natranaerobius trueperi]
MSDQAENLRKLVKKNNKISKTTVVTVASGKGGVGKSSFTVNLALALKDLGKKVMLVDGNFGLYNLDILFGIKANNQFENLLKKEIEWKQAVTEVSPGISLLCGGKNHINTETINFDFIENICEEENYDFIIIDTGAGVSELGFKLINLSNISLVLTTPELTAITDTYALIKSLIYERTLSDLHLVVNKCETENEAQFTWKKINKVLQHFVGSEINLFGYIHEDQIITESIRKQQPALLLKPFTPSGISIRSLARKLVSRYM